jgi:tyrosinase
MTVSLGPIGGILKDVPLNPREDGYGANPRCLRRDVNRYASSVLYANYTYALIQEADTIDLFQKNMLGMPEKNDWGVHMAGHYTIGGDPGGVSRLFLLYCELSESFVVDLGKILTLFFLQDFFSSPGDPLFWFHHGMVDRIWWIWQMQDPEKRMNVLPENPPRDDVIDLNWTAKKVDTWDTVDSVGGMGGEMCYIYV